MIIFQILIKSRFTFLCMSIVKIRKNGTFYHVLDEDSYILYYLLGYNIKNEKVGFSKSALNKVINKLEENKINYLVVGENLNYNFKNLNKYAKYLKLGKEKYNKDILNEMYKITLEKILFFN